MFYRSGLVPAALNVEHGYKNFWIRDGYYIGLCYGGSVKERLWNGVVDILDRYKWKLEIHAQIPPKHWYEYIHIRYDPDGKEIEEEQWLHTQWDCIGNLIEICLDKNRLDLASLLVDYLKIVRYDRQPAAGAWEDRTHSSDAYSLAACITALQRAKEYLPEKAYQIEKMVKRGCTRLNLLLPFATTDKMVCLSLLGVIWPFNVAGPYKNEIIRLVKQNLQREPFGFIRYRGDSYDGENFSQDIGSEYPWLLGDLLMNRIEPDAKLWKRRIDHAYDIFKCMPEAYNPVDLKPNRNTPLLWAEALYDTRIK